MDIEGATPPSSVSERSEDDDTPLPNVTAVPTYYNWFAILLCDLFKSQNPLMKYTLGDMEIIVPEDRLEYTVEQFIDNRKQQEIDSGEYKPSPLIARCMDRFLFSGSQRTDMSIVRFLDWLPVPPYILHADYGEKFKQADVQTQLYSINSVQGQNKFPWFFGFPCCPITIKLQIHCTANKTLLCMDIAQVAVEDTVLFRKFFGLIYGAVHWLLNNEQNSPLPPGCSPLLDLTLRDNFKGYPSNRIFLEDDRVYKFYENDDVKVPNLALMEQLGYFDELNCQQIGNSHTLLSYKLLYSWKSGTIKPKTDT